MQAPRNWRMKNERYQVTVNQNQDGSKSIVNRPAPLARNEEDNVTAQRDLLGAAAA